MPSKMLSVPVPSSLADLLFTTSEHAGVAPDLITDSGRFPPGALDVVREEGGQPS
jgi:hypothetical protein